ncbi:MAG: 4-carboxymuconolactone decarboxylase [Rhodospirillaceae bacterium]|nr:4-carboxymuconolactone decarboxylase [Rhodospirillaceae bacterium]HAA93527.1 4-carboxymuconolactone decarboxylase [Rhodospirillaceae bacterium]|tara:strand:+ start:284 stop:733 length:450 start_codon:yes stop_codon:yes gene_type:complete
MANDNLYDETEKFLLGQQTRREVVGDKWVDDTIERDGEDAFSAPLNQYLVENIWGGIWPRPGLSRKERSMINLALLAANGFYPDLYNHMGGAVRNGMTKEEIGEVLLQVTAYAGAPCGVNAFKVARRFFRDNDMLDDAGPDDQKDGGEI